VLDGGEAPSAVGGKSWVSLQLREDEREVRQWPSEDGPRGGRCSPRERDGGGA
jgi:hypothetical protein